MRTRTPATHLALAVMLLLLMAAVRLHNLTLQEPFIDEGAHVQRARAVWSFDENPGRFANGKLLLYYWLGVFELPPVDALWIARAAIALTSLLTGATVYALARMTGGPGAGRLALAVYAALPLAFFHERMALADPLAALFMALTAWRSVALARRPTALRALAAGLLAAATTLAKLTTGYIPLLPVFATLLYGGARDLRAWKRRYGRALALVVGTILAAWIPLLIPAAIAHARGEPFTLVNGANIADLDAPSPLAELDATLRALASYTSAPLLLALVAGLGWLAWRGRRNRAIRPHALYFMAWVALLLIFPAIASRDPRTRYFMPLAVPLSVVIGWAAGELWRTRHRAARVALAGAAAAWLGGFAIPFGVTAVTSPADLSLPRRDAAVFLGGNFAGDAFRRVVALLDTMEPPGQIVADRAACDMLYFFTAEPIVCAADIARPVELLAAQLSYVVLNGHEPQPDRMRLAWELVAEFERPKLRELAGVTRTAQVWRVRAP
ncbi:MAG TPA: hypothetical protein PKD46_01315 [Aggregatilineaceae bacterium]|nr:hypothetical protein [Aggregatilineaceae bacterium]